MNRLLMIALTVVVLAGITSIDAEHKPTKVEMKQKSIQAMAEDTLTRLYLVDPPAQQVIKGAAGYAVFSNFGMKILIAGTGNGQGIAVNNSTKAKTFMKMIEVQAGLGMGVTKFQVVFVFDNRKVLEAFINKGWQFGGQATAAIKNGNSGAAKSGAVSVSDGVWMYQLTDKGIALEITAKSTKYYKDDVLNSALATK